MLRRTQLFLDQLDAYQRTGQWGAALSLSEKLFRDSWHNRKPDELLEVLLRTGFLFIAKGDRLLAIEHLELALTIAELRSDHPRAGRALNAMGVFYQSSGALDTAYECYSRGIEKEAKSGDRLLRGDLEVNLGTIANVRGDLQEALHRYESALSSYEGVGNRVRLAQVLNNLGMLHIDLQAYDRAAEALERGLNISRSIPDLPTEGILKTNRTELFLATGNLEAARDSCDAAYEIARQLEDSALKADILKFYGIIFKELGDLSSAEAHLGQAIALAGETKNPLHEAEATRELGLVLRAGNRNREALQALNRAYLLFSALQAKQDQADIVNRLGQLEEDFLSLVAKWGESIEAKDLYTSGHCQRVANYACRIGKAAGMSAFDLKWFRMGAFLHDVGKTAVPEEILNKPGRLSDEERQLIEQHTVAGDEILSTIEFPWEIRPMVRSHHERWDGRGYPDGLSEDRIPYTARILKIADVFDALTSTRSYRESLSPQEAFQIMESDSGSYDPDLFEIFRSIFPSLIESDLNDLNGYQSASTT